MLGQDLLKLPGYGGYCDGIPHLHQHGLQPAEGGVEIGWVWGEKRTGSKWSVGERPEGVTI